MKMHSMYEAIALKSIHSLAVESQSYYSRDLEQQLIIHHSLAVASQFYGFS